MLLRCIVFLIFGVAVSAVRRVVIGVDGGTESIRACCFDGATGHVLGKASAHSYATTHPHAGWAEQDPSAWWQCLGKSVREAVRSLGEDVEDVEFCGIAVDTTCCSVVTLDASNEPLRPSLLWMDQRSAPQTAKVLATGDTALDVNCNGEGPISAEWMTPKALWIAEQEPNIWKKSRTICEYQDFINMKLTGIMCASSCNAASRWHWDGVECTKEPTPEDPLPGRPLELYRKLGIPELAQKLPKKCIPMGSRVGSLTLDAGDKLGLPEGLPVIQGGPDAFVGMIGLGCINPGQLCLITGSSHLHCVITDKPSTAPGTWGAYRGAPLPTTAFAEGGQSSTGSILRFAKGLFDGSNDESSKLSYEVLDDEASKVSAGSDGLLALETFQGSRTPVTDPLARGAIVGLTLSHTRAHVWRALLEAVCFGTRSCVEGLAAAGHKCDSIVLAGGVTRAPLWLQMHADVTGKVIYVCENSEAPLLGCAILASFGAGIHKSIPDAVSSMVRTALKITPDATSAAIYEKIYNEIYCKIGPAIRPISHAIQSLRGGNTHIQPSLLDNDVSMDSIAVKPIVSPSLLACDWANIRGEVHRCMDAGLFRFHIDIFDGVFLDSPYAMTFGPQMVQAIRQSCESWRKAENGVREASLDLHMCVDRPRRFIEPMASMGADCFIFQWEAMADLDEATVLAEAISSAGMRSGISINPQSNVQEIVPLLLSGLIDVVDVLAVEPGFGGQKYQPLATEKIHELRKIRETGLFKFDIMVDGGVNKATVREISDAGPDILVAGSFLFQAEHSIRQRVNMLSDTV